MGVRFNPVTAQVEQYKKAGGNATVPDDAPIQPPQAFVDCMLVSAFLPIDQNSTLDWSSKGITVIDASLLGFLRNLDTLWTDHNGNGLKLNLGNNPIVSGNDLLACLVASGTSNGYLDLTGIPVTPVHVDGVWTIAVTGVPVGTIELTGQSNGTGLITFGVNIDVTSGNAQAIADNLQDYINNLSIGWTAASHAGVVTVTVTEDNEFPLTPGADSATNLTITNTAAGVAQNADKTTLEGNGWIVTTN